MCDGPPGAAGRSSEHADPHHNPGPSISYFRLITCSQSNFRLITCSHPNFRLITCSGLQAHHLFWWPIANEAPPPRSQNGPRTYLKAKDL